jgi:hypothetical protein
MEYEPILALFQVFEPLFGIYDLDPVPYPHQGEKSNPDPHQNKNQNPDPEPDPHQGDKSNPDPHQSYADPQHCRAVTVA